MNKKYQLVAPCLFGLESILKFECTRIGGTDVTATDGRVSFTGDLRTIAKANLWLRTAERVQIVLGTFPATTFTQLFDQVEALPFEEYIGEYDEFPVKGWSIDSQLASVPSCQSIIKKAVVRRLESVYHREIFPETGSRHQIAFSIFKDEVSIMLDTTGDPLYKRGYRKNTNIAPIRETLAAGIVDLARIRSEDQVYDPMCGSGTLLIEAAQRALNIAPGLQRTFDMERWELSEEQIWTEERGEAIKSIHRSVKFHGYGSDIDEEILHIAQENARLAGVEDRITFTHKNILEFHPEPPAVVLSNPPYGERMLESDEVYELYQGMGKVMPQAKGMHYYIIGPPKIFEPAFGRKADRRRKLYNGMLETQLYMYFR